MKSTGDGVLLEFPSVVDAVECAVAVQAVMAQRNEGVPVDRRMVFRIGVPYRELGMQALRAYVRAPQPLEKRNADEPIETPKFIRGGSDADVPCSRWYTSRCRGRLE